MAAKTIYLIDGSSFAYRAFYAIGQLATHTGQPTNAVYGFTRMLNKLVDKYKPEYLLVAFDTGKPTFRHEKYLQYKAHRKPMPDEMIAQIPWIKKIIQAYNIPLVEMEGYEADDIIATMAAKAEGEGFNVYIFSNDKDLMQLVNSNTKLINPAKEDFIYSIEEIKEKFGVGPCGITHLLALTGDSSDNIMGVPGIGEKTASRLIGEFGDVNGLLNNLDNIPPKLKTVISEHKERILDNLDLVTVKKDIIIDIKPQDCVVKEHNKNALKDIFRELEFNALLKELLENSPFSLGCEIKEDWQEVLRDLMNIQALSITPCGLAYEKDCEIKSVNIDIFSDSAWKDISKILQNPAIKKYGYDIKLILRKDIKIEGGIFDVFIAESLLETKFIEEGKSLAAQIYKKVPELEKQLIDKGLYNLYQRVELPLIEVLADMENCGIKLDTAILKELSIGLEKDLLQLTSKIHKYAGEEFNINSPKQLENILFSKLKLPKGRRTKTGFSTDVDVLETLSKLHELPKFVLEYRQLNKLKNTYIDPLPQLVDPSTNRLHTTFNQVGAVTGRISSSNPNLQNIPIKTDLGVRIRSAFIPDGEDYVLLGADYSQIELRILAHLSGDKILIDAFNHGMDIHTQTAKEIFGVKEVTQELRRQAKVVNFGIIYGMGAKAMASGLGISMEEAQRFIDAYLDRYPDVARYINCELKDAKENGYVVTMFGRKRRVPELSSVKPKEEALGKRIAINTPIQGSAADIIKMAMVNIHKRIKEKKLPVKMLLQVHDELIFEMHERFADNVSNLVKEEMENVVKLKVPLKVDIKVGRSWADL